MQKEADLVFEVDYAKAFWNSRCADAPIASSPFALQL